MSKIRGKSRKYTDPAYYEANRIETGLNHIDRGRFTYSHIDRETWDAIFGSDSGSRRKQENTQKELEDTIWKATHSVDHRSGIEVESNDVGC